MLGSNRPALSSKTYDVEDFAAAQELFHSNGWTDGLPVVPPTEAAVEACLEWALMPPEQLIGIEPIRAQPITAALVVFALGYLFGRLGSLIPTGGSTRRA